ncbi:heterokaryon incompatibility protein-domain-containing protein [Paraphoma chrysanthemicola]|uniref:Heterokaryon incompatibility protein-domain-containing protein n=1 Tax=Paraphoma chrysanthemicola TaxID=798071 RepID=A0A8K0VVP1_9PLEO|nr:heterokaryon incompatibility protein-domain-containing protein [Paraphoma chrysanthemicola]
MPSQGFYPALETTGTAHNIRILDLDESSGDERRSLKGTIRVVSLIDRPSYTALSYVWGDFDKKYKYKIGHGDSTIEITPSCFYALQDIRRHFGRISIWVDSICIDQSNNLERNHQVRIMEEIYSQAYMVYVWLDYDQLKSHKQLGAFEPLRRLARGETKWYGKHCVDTFNMRYMFQHEWFVRGWTLQEAALAKNVLLVAEDDFIHWDNLAPAIAYLERVPADHLGQSNFHYLAQLRNMFAGDADVGRSVFDSAPIMQQMRQRRVSKDHDIAYAYYGLLQRAGAQLTEVDYTRQAIRVLCEFFRDLIRWDQSFMILLEDPGMSIPTWLPFKCNKQPVSHLGTETLAEDSRSNLQYPCRGEENNDAILAVRGSPLCLVACSITEADPRFATFLERSRQRGWVHFVTLRHWLYEHWAFHKIPAGLVFHQIKTALQQFAFEKTTWINDQYFTLENVSLWIEHLFDCLCDEDFLKSHRCDMECYHTLLYDNDSAADHFNYVGNALVRQMDKVSGGMRILEAIKPLLEVSTLIIASDGAIGIGPQCAEVGDQICRIAGVPTPLILRKEPTGRFRVIGKIALQYSEGQVLPVNDTCLEEFELVSF